MKAQELRSMTEGALQAELANRQKELLKTRCQVALGEEVRPHQIAQLKKGIARILTVLREKTGEPAKIVAGGKA